MKKVKLPEINREYINTIANDFCINAQDGALIMALYEQIRGPQLSELINLKFTDIDADNTSVNLTDNQGNTRVLKVSEELIEILTEAFEQKTYFSHNCATEEKLYLKRLQESEYVFKTSSNNEKIAYQTLFQRLKTIVSEYGEPFLTIDRICGSIK